MLRYVNCNAKPHGDGSKEKPFSKIQQAAAIALPGDEIIVAPGVYREEVSPVNAGTEKKPIVSGGWKTIARLKAARSITR